MTASLKSTGLAALAFSLSVGLISAIVPSAASASTSNDVDVIAPLGREIVTHRVSVADLDLASAADVRKLDSRIRRASNFVCAEPGALGALSEVRCRSDARRSADQQVAALRDRATALAAAGLPSRIATSISVTAG